MKKLIGIISKQSNRYIISGITSFEELNNSSYINYWDEKKPANKQGLQRKPVQVHYRKLANAIANNATRTWIPTPIIMSAGSSLEEQKDPHGNIIGFKETEGLKVELLNTVTKTENQLVELSYSDNPFSVIDGQHRLKALEYLVKDKRMPNFSSYQLPFIIMFPTDKIDEIITFIDLNSKGKRVKTDLANQLKLDINSKDKTYNQSDVEIRKMITTQVANNFNSNVDSVWYQKIGIGNNNLNTIVSSTSWVSSLSKIYSLPSVKSKYESTTRDVNSMSSSLTDIINKYWQILFKIAPELFPEDIKEAEKYVIQKSIGLSVMNQVLIGILGKYIAKPIDKISSEELYDFIASYLEKDEYLTVDFWKSASKKDGIVGGIASESSSESAFKKLSEEIMDSISDKYYSEE